MGPLADLRIHENTDQQQSRTVKWTDNEENDKERLRTNKSEDDLVCKDEIHQIDCHRKNNLARKKSIKPFTLNMTEVTGVQEIDGVGKSSHKNSY